MRQQGLVIASHGRHVVVEAADGSRRLCHPRGKKNQAVVGDRVWWLPSSDEGSIEAVESINPCRMRPISSGRSAGAVSLAYTGSRGTNRALDSRPKGDWKIGRAHV